ncbi:hypothetical protein MCOR06_007435 [Pyricularia oryzae]|nr:hypothetical protein MCOR06_007435 [Pyricularia oryzae]
MARRGKLLEDLSSTPEGCRSLSMLQHELMYAVRDINTIFAARALISMSGTGTVQASPPPHLKPAAPRPRRPLPRFPVEYAPQAVIKNPTPMRMDKVREKK